MMFKEEDSAQEEEKKDNIVDEQAKKRIKASIKLIMEMKKLFGSMVKSDKKYADPTGVLQSIVDDLGNPV